MAQIILLQSYIGPAALFTYDVTCSGAKIQGAEKEKLLLRYHSQNGNAFRYRPEWYSVKPGDVITIRLISQEEVMDKQLAYTVPERGLLDPPLHMDDERAGCSLHVYLDDQGCSFQEYLPREVSS